MKPDNRIWMELDRYEGDPKDRKVNHDLNHERAALMTGMWRRLVPAEPNTVFRWNEKKSCYIYYAGGAGYEYLPDNGKWFNLDYLGRPLEEGEAA